MTGQQGSTLVRRVLGNKLRDLRARAGKSTLDVAEGGICSRSTLTKIEAGRQEVRVPMVVALCALYGVDEATSATLCELAKGTKTPGWSESYGDVVPEQLQIYLEAEATADHVYLYDGEAVPGLLQTDEYAAALFAGEDRRRSPEYVDRLVRVQHDRRRRFWGSGAPASLTSVINEAALCRMVGGRETMARQVEYLRKTNEQDRAEVRVLTFSVGAHPALYGAFTIFTFGDPDYPPGGYHDTYSGGTYLETTEPVDRLTAVHRRIYTMSTAIEEYA